MNVNCKERVTSAICGAAVIAAAILLQFWPQPKSHTIVFINTSLSARPQLPSFLRVAVEIVSAQARSKSQVTIYRFDSRVEEFWDRSASGQTDTVEQNLARQVMPTSERDNTYFDKVFDELVARTKDIQVPITLVVLTDGYSEGLTPEGHARIRKDAVALAHNTWITGVAVIGAKSPTWAEIRADLAPLQEHLGKRFLLESDTDINSRDVLALIKSAGTRAGPFKQLDPPDFP